ncbi:hypothetical protein EDC04DRAFT_2600777 [Pisolithus marmoratus]|nr:hypothetical protein EDC04DRAFT_2600777 [Pisolithus marmoratus]
MDEDLGVGFFFREEVLGKKTMKHNTLLERESLDALVRSVDLLPGIACRRFGKPFYAGGAFGLLGHMFRGLFQVRLHCTSFSTGSDEEVDKGVEPSCCVRRTWYRWFRVADHALWLLDRSTVYMYSRLVGTVSSIDSNGDPGESYFVFPSGSQRSVYTLLAALHGTASWIPPPLQPKRVSALNYRNETAGSMLTEDKRLSSGLCIPDHIYVPEILVTKPDHSWCIALLSSFESGSPSTIRRWGVPVRLPT